MATKTVKNHTRLRMRVAPHAVSKRNPAFIRSSDKKRIVYKKKVHWIPVEYATDPEAFDAFIRRARLDYLRGNYKTAHSIEELIADLNS